MPSGPTLRRPATTMTADGAGREVAPPTSLRIGGRYDLTETIGRGGQGDVWAATDIVTGRDVVVKLLVRGSRNQQVRVSREIAALRLLQLPGVVRLLDDGAEEHRDYVVMERAPGTAFPGEGATRRWSVLGPRVASLLAAVGPVHALGIVHRDLKPANVLVDEAGRVTLLDFGIARGEALGADITQPQAPIGTMLYLSPEQAAGADHVDHRADLYAIGLLTVEALIGRPVFAELPRAEFLANRIAGRMPAGLLESLDVPDAALGGLRRLLAPHAEDRPSSAAEALADLGLLAAPPELPWLGDPALVERLAGLLDDGRSVDVWGPPGSGRTRLLGEVAIALRARGRAALFVQRADQPLRSLAAALALGASALTGPEAARAALEAVLDRGTAILADDDALIDRTTRRILDELTPHGRVLRVRPAPGAVTIPPLEPADLEPLFLGPDRILHLRSDAARLLHARTAGRAGRVGRELEAWSAVGLVVRGETGWRPRREGLERIAAGLLAPPQVFGTLGRAPPWAAEVARWLALAGVADADVLAKAMGPSIWEVEEGLQELVAVGAAARLDDGRYELVLGPPPDLAWTPSRRASAHLALARALAPGAPRRLFHLAAAGEPGDLAAEAVLLAGAASRDGRPGAGLAVLSLAASRCGPSTPDEERQLLSTELTRLALAEGTVDALLATRITLDRLGAPEGASQAALLRAFEMAEREDPRRGRGWLRGVGTLSDPELADQAQALQIRAHLPADPAGARALLASLPPTSRPETIARRAEWAAQIALQEGQPVEARQALEGCAATAPSPQARARLLVNAGRAWRDGGWLERALDAFVRARVDAEAHRLALLEAHAVVGERGVRYRLGEALAPDAELVEILRALRAASIVAVAEHTEAAFAWRAGDWALGEALGRSAVETWERRGNLVGEIIGAVLAYACGGPPLLPPLRARMAARSLDPAFLRQVEAVEAWGPRRPVPAVGGRRGVILSPEEVAAMIAGVQR